ncbi:radical SAM protein [Candidatus Aerophobetes bacterium]|uniref:Radical SAM protein n=1 Tax=Aerophobetes bacterium TaxID=2030807 RepID=A0A523W8G1_UNCAE|nr:MAG: radical SAM protein [Candidatus Aerophobetes bacterium]
MIGCTKLICGKATVSETIKYEDGEIPSNLLQFSTNSRPIVVWNLNNRCNLNCKHCYIEANDEKEEGELSTEEAKRFIQDLGKLKIPVLLFSGGEPLLREDVYELATWADKEGIRPILSTNGTLISQKVAKRLKTSGFKYIGISLDGLEEVHDDFRNRVGAFQQALAGLQNAMEAGLKSGVRFTISEKNKDELPQVLDLVKERKIPRFCMYHLVYSGRGKELVSLDTSKVDKKKTIEFIIERTLKLCKEGTELEILTVDNPVDGIMIYRYIQKRYPEKADEVYQLLRRAGGCSAGEKIANVDPQGEVHPCQFWQNLSLGNVKEKSFAEIWLDTSNHHLRKLRAKANYLKGRCRECEWVKICGGCRVRAEATYGDPWEEDPACYLEV